MISDSCQNLALQLNCAIVPHFMGPSDYAVFTVKDGKNTVFYNKTLSAEEVNIVVAKALIHFQYNRAKREFYINKYTTLRQKEIADVYELLIPEKTVKYLLSQLIAPKSVFITKYFGVTEEFLKKRLDFLDFTGNLEY